MRVCASRWLHFRNFRNAGYCGLVGTEVGSFNLWAGNMLCLSCCTFCAPGPKGFIFRTNVWVFCVVSWRIKSGIVQATP